MSAVAKFPATTFDARDDEKIARVHDFLTAHEAAVGDRPEPRYLLVGAEAGDQVELPEEVYSVLRQVVDAMRKGQSVTLAPTSKVLTSQQAADLIGISRPTLIKLLNENEIPYTRVGTHRRIALSDALRYRDHRRERQHAALEALSAAVDETESIDETLEDLKRARKAAAAARRRHIVS